MGTSSCALFKDGKLIAAVEEERLSRIKNDGSFPLLAIRECLKIANIKINSIDYIFVYWKPFKIFKRLQIVIKKIFNINKTKFILYHLLSKFFGYYDFKLKKNFPTKQGSWLELFIIRRKIKKIGGNFRGKIIFLNHHDCHIEYALNLSNFDESILISFDGGGEEESTVICISKKDSYKIIKRINWPNSLGHFYSFFTGFLGFKMLEDEYKMMGMSPYGDNKYTKFIQNEILRTNNNGSYEFNYNDYDYHMALYDYFPKVEEKLNLKIRKKNEKILKEDLDLAKSVQDVFEKTLINIVKSVKKKFPKLNNLILTGGCALNVSANGKILKEKIVDKIFIPPAPHDAGCAIGAPLIFLKKNSFEIDIKSLRNPYLGYDFNNKEIENSFKKLNLKIPPYFETNLLIDKCTDFLKDEKIIAWYQGKSEFGPRALGNRSFLADPRKEKIKEVLNKSIKHRESFRPFAPSILEDYIEEYFHLKQKSPYMNIVADVKNEKIKDIRAVVHIDKSARVHSVSKNENETYYKLIESFYKKTSIPLLLNTSLNIKEPIVYTPTDAIKTFIKSDVDLLVMGNYYCTKNWKEHEWKTNVF